MTVAACAVRRISDAAVDYVVEVGGCEVGAIRPRGLGTAELHLQGRGLLLRRDDTADVVRKGGSWWETLGRLVGFNQRYSLRDEESILATASREFRLAIRADGYRMVLPGLPAPEVTVQSLDGLWSDQVVHDNGRRIARISSSGHGRRFEWHGPVPADIASAIFALYVLHQSFGQQPTREF